MAVPDYLHQLFHCLAFKKYPTTYFLDEGIWDKEVRKVFETMCKEFLK